MDNYDKAFKALNLKLDLIIKILEQLNTGEITVTKFVKLKLRKPSEHAKPGTDQLHCHNAETNPHKRGEG